MARITGNDLERFREAIAPLDTEDVRDRYRRRDIPRAETVRDIDQRYRWDLYHAAGGWRLHANMEDVKDIHIDTALRNIVASL